MTASVLETPTRAQSTSTRTVTTPQRTGAGRRLRPVARPERSVPTPNGLRGTAVRSCSDVAPIAVPAVQATSAPRTWRLTERGIALVLVLATMVAVAAVAVVGLTAARVTAESFAPYGQSALR